MSSSVSVSVSVSVWCGVWCECGVWSGSVSVCVRVSLTRSRPCVHTLSLYALNLRNEVPQDVFIQVYGGSVLTWQHLIVYTVGQEGKTIAIL